MRKGVRRFTGACGAIVLIGGLTGACTVPVVPLACRAGVSAAHPLQRTDETITVRTVPGARVTTAVHYRVATVVKVATSNALGVASTVYNIGPAAIGYPVKVTVAVTKSSRRGACSTGFTPAPTPTTRPPTPPPSTGPVTLSCPEVGFPPKESARTPMHSYNIKATGTDCGEAHRLATAVYSSGPHGGYPYSMDGYSCGYGSNITCINSAANAKVTFNFSGYAPTDCGTGIDLPGTWAIIDDVQQISTDCPTARGVAQFGLGITQGAAFSQSGFACTVWTQIPQPPYANAIAYNCYSPSKLEWIGFTYVTR